MRKPKHEKIGWKRNRRNKISLLISLSVLILVAIGCETGPPKISKVVISDQKDAKENKLTFKSNDTIHSVIEIENNLDDLKIKANLTAEEDIYDLKKGDVFPGTDGTENFASDKDKQILEYSHPEGFPAGKYKVNLELQDRDGKKLDSKSVEIKVEESGETDGKSKYSPPIGNGG